MLLSGQQERLDDLLEFVQRQSGQEIGGRGGRVCADLDDVIFSASDLGELAHLVGEVVLHVDDQAGEAAVDERGSHGEHERRCLAAPDAADDENAMRPLIEGNRVAFVEFVERQRGGVGLALLPSVSIDHSNVSSVLFSKSEHRIHDCLHFRFARFQ